MRQPVNRELTVQNNSLQPRRPAPTTRQRRAPPTAGSRRSGSKRRASHSQRPCTSRSWECAGPGLPAGLRCSTSARLFRAPRSTQPRRSRLGARICQEHTSATARRPRRTAAARVPQPRCPPKVALRPCQTRSPSEVCLLPGSPQPLPPAPLVGPRAGAASVDHRWRNTCCASTRLHAYCGGGYPPLKRETHHLVGSSRPSTTPTGLPSPWSRRNTPMGWPRSRT
mmetsp:Transcript_39908/g.127916  ORF Transcript_39908/g.127916 Transcript_39908/m.127916 type:complete len:225 (-) Transcript_39908:289-963(-)